MGGLEVQVLSDHAQTGGQQERLEALLRCTILLRLLLMSLLKSAYTTGLMAEFTM